MTPTDQLSSIILGVIYIAAGFCALKLFLDIIEWFSQIGWRKVGKYALGTLALVTFFILDIWYLYGVYVKNHPTR